MHALEGADEVMKMGTWPKKQGASNEPMAFVRSPELSALGSRASRGADARRTHWRGTTEDG